MQYTYHGYAEQISAIYYVIALSSNYVSANIYCYLSYRYL